MPSSLQEFFFRYPRLEPRLHLNVVPTGTGVFKSRHILLHIYVNRIMITYHDARYSSLFPAAASDPLNVAIFTCFESMSRDRFYHELLLKPAGPLGQMRTIS
jgi:hypothetical protein